MKHHGLFSVFLGLEDGTDSGLLRMNKRLKVSDHLSAVHILKNLGIGLDFGFMLFQPATTFTSFRENLKFLGFICDDGYMPVTFLKMLPYMETKIKNELTFKKLFTFGPLSSKLLKISHGSSEKKVCNNHHPLHIDC